MFNSTRRGFAVLAATAVLVVGCGSGVRKYPVAGVVEFEDGTPLEGGLVEFSGLENKARAAGQVKKDGTFQLTSDREGDGAPSGKYRVIVIQGSMPIGMAPAGAQSEHRHESRRLHPKHGQYETSGLTAEVEPVSANKVRLVVESAESGTGEQPRAE